VVVVEMEVEPVVEAAGCRRCDSALRTMAERGIETRAVENMSSNFLKQKNEGIQQNKWL
jgi:glutaredoxin